MKKRTALKFCMVILMAAALLTTACGKKKDEATPLPDEEPGLLEDIEGSLYDEIDAITPPEDEIMGDLPGYNDDEDAWFDDMFPGEETVEWSEEMNAIRSAVADEFGDDYWPQAPMPAEYLEMNYGITSDMYEDYMGEMPLMSFRVDEILVVKAADGKADAVEQLLEDYRQKVLDNSMQYPMNMAKSQACVVKRVGNYVCFVLMGGDITEYEEQGDEAIIAHCIEDNNRVIEIISGIIQ